MENVWTCPNYPIKTNASMHFEVSDMITVMRRRLTPPTVAGFPVVGWVGRFLIVVDWMWPASV